MYLDAYITPCPAYGWIGGPEFQTRIVELQNGRERRNANWSQPRHRYSISFLNIGLDEVLAIKRMILACRGMLHVFRFRDQFDYQAANETFAIGDSTTKGFQLAKYSIVDGLEYRREVYALAGSPQITIDGVPTSAYVVDLDTGWVEFDTSPPNGAVLAWSGLFDIWVRFGQDYNPFSLDGPNAANGTVELIEVAPPPISLPSG